MDEDTAILVSALLDKADEKLAAARDAEEIVQAVRQLLFPAASTPGTQQPGT